MDLNEAFTHVIQGDACLFLGAGFSVGAKNENGGALRTAGELTKFLASQADAPDGATLEDAAEAFQRKFGSSHLVDFLIKEYSVGSVADHHLTVAKEPWMRVYTTNWDNVFEFAAQEKGKAVQAITSDSDPFRLQPKEMSCIHLNGYIKRLTLEALTSTFKLTETSYITSSIADTPWASRLREDCRLARAVFFLGYGMFDLDVRRILVDNPHLKEKCFFIVSPDTSDLLIQRVERFGQSLRLGVEKFGARLSNFSLTNRADFRRSLSLTSLEEFAAPQHRNPTDRDLLDLFELGRVDEGAIAASRAHAARYFLERTKAVGVIERLESGSKAVAISSALANGKTLFLNGLALTALEHGYRVFRNTAQTDTSIRDFEKVAKQNGKILLIVDNYQGWLDAIRAYSQVASDSTRLIVSARDSIHDVLYDRLETDTGLRTIPEINIDRLDDNEIAWFVDTFEEFGLWRSLAGRSRHEKVKRLKDNYSGQVHGILLGLLESEDLANRVRKLVKDSLKDRSCFEVVTSIFILNIVNHPSTIDTLHELWGAELISSVAFRQNPGIRQLIDFDKWEVRVRSSVLSEYSLRSTDAAELVPVLTKLTRHAGKAAKAIPRFANLFAELVKFSTIQRVLPEAGRMEGTVKYYENVKDLPRAQRNPLFWLQYAIGCLVGGDLKRAKTYFDTSYSLANNRDFDTFQIDNHFARYLLVATNESNVPVGRAIELFREARAIINRQMQHERLHYPFRVASSYQDFVDKFGSKLSPEACSEISAAAEYVIERIAQLPEDRARHPAVRRCGDAMAYVVERCEQLSIRNKQK